MKGLGAFLITIALIVGLVSCVYPPPFIPYYDLTISSTEGGSVTTPGEGTFTYTDMEVVEVVAEADEGYQFVEWTGDVRAVDDVNGVHSVPRGIVVHAVRHRVEMNHAQQGAQRE